MIGKWKLNAIVDTIIKEYNRMPLQIMAGLGTTDVSYPDYHDRG